MLLSVRPSQMFHIIPDEAKTASVFVLGNSLFTDVITVALCAVSTADIRK
jgi:hypothetical protein